MNTNLDIAQTIHTIGTLPIWLAITLVVIGFLSLVVFGILLLIKNEHIRMLFTNKANYNLDMILREKLYAEIKQIDSDCEWEVKNYLNSTLQHNFGGEKYCILPRELLLWRIEKKAEDWVEQNHLMQKVFRDSVEMTKQECIRMVTKIVHSYKFIMDTLDDCEKVDPEFKKDFETKDSLKEEIEDLVEKFLGQVRKSVTIRTHKKIEVYADYREKFKTKIVRQIAVEEPFQKNQKYLAKL